MGSVSLRHVYHDRCILDVRRDARRKICRSSEAPLASRLRTGRLVVVALGPTGRRGVELLPRDRRDLRLKKLCGGHARVRRIDGESCDVERRFSNCQP